MTGSTEPLAFEAIGTHWQISLPDGLLPSKREALLAEVTKRIEAFDKDYSRFRPDSLVTNMSRQAGTYELPADAQPMFLLYEDAYRLTGGAVTPLIGQVLSDAGYDAFYSLEARPLRIPPHWNETMVRNGLSLEVKEPGLLDFGAAGKGYLIDIVAAILKREGIGSFCVDAGGDMAQHDAAQKSLRVALEHPDDSERAIGIAEICNRSLCGSAGNRRAWGDFHHIIDPSTLSSPRHIKAVWTVAETTLLADMMTTCLFFKAPEFMKRHYDFEYLIMRADNSIESSPNFPAELFI